MTHDLRATISSLLQDQGEDRLGSVVREAVRPIIEDAFRKGLRIGLDMGRDATMRGMAEALNEIQSAFESPTPATRPHRTKSKVARGTIAPLIDLVLSDSPGLRAAEVEAKVVELDAAIKPASVGNELRRQRNKRYRRDGVRWFLADDTGRTEGLGRDASPRSEAGETELGMPDSGPPVGKAA